MTCTIYILAPVCIVAVDIFVLISGYFMVDFTFKLKNIVKIWREVWIYSFCFSIIGFLFGAEISKRAILSMVFPISTRKYWFVNTYFSMVLISPFLNKFIHEISKKQLKMVLSVLLLLFCLRPTIFPMSWTIDSSGGMGILWFIVLYFVAAYIKFYYKPSSTKRHMWYYIFASGLLFISKMILEQFPIGIDYTKKLYNYNSILVLISACSLFLCFLHRKPIEENMGKFINKVAKYSFSVYIIHFTVNNLIWTKWLHINTIVERQSPFGLVAIFIGVVVVYIFCTLVDIIRSYIENKCGILNEFFEKLGNKIEKIYMENW